MEHPPESDRAFVKGTLAPPIPGCKCFYVNWYELRPLLGAAIDSRRRPNQGCGHDRVRCAAPARGGAPTRSRAPRLRGLRGAARHRDPPRGLPARLHAARRARARAASPGLARHPARGDGGAAPGRAGRDHPWPRRRHGRDPQAPLPLGPCRAARHAREAAELARRPGVPTRGRARCSRARRPAGPDRRTPRPARACPRRGRRRRSPGTAPSGRQPFPPDHRGPQRARRGWSRP